MKTTLFITGAFFMATAIAMGAMGAHYLGKHLDAGQLQSYETGVRYMVYHALAMLVLSQLPWLKPAALKLVYILMLVGIIFFSFSIFLLATRPLHGWNVGFLGPFTPVGGLLLLISWAILIVKVAFHGKQAGL